MYLEDLSEETLYQAYSGVIDSSGMQGSFEGFSQENRDSLFRMKMVSIDRRIR